MPHRRVYLLCPLAVEARGLRGRSGSIAAPIVVGPRVRGVGLSGPAAWVAAHAARVRSSGGVVVLAGVAGALRSPPQVGEAIVVDEAIAVDGGAWICREPVPSGLARGTVISIDEVAADGATKRRLAAGHPRAAIVDLESASFAAEAERNDVRWLVVRGVSDGIDDDLPPGVESWTDADGSTRLGAVAAALARRPTMMSSVLRLGRRTTAAMGAVGRVLERLAPAIA